MHRSSHRVGAEDAESEKNIFSAISVVMRKNPKIIKIAKSYVKEIKYLQVLIFAKSDFFSRPVPLR